MSRRGANFRDSWISENIHADAFVQEDGDDRPKHYMQQMINDAAVQGISQTELEYELSDDLEDYIRLAMDSAAMNEVHRLAAKDD